ncbi:hypothetical protein L208DRAFT_1188476, partial [Tricholoma matsutake]
YLNFGPSRALWAYYADAIMILNIPKTEKNIRNETQRNIFLQTWKTYTGNHPNNQNPIEIKNMLETTKKYGTQLEVLMTTKDITRQLPIWYHAQAERRIRHLINTQHSKCLFKTHHI